MADRKRAFRGDRLRLMRERRGLSQAQLEELLGLGNTSIHRYEKNSSEPTPGVLAALSRQLGCSSDYLLGLVDEPNQHLGEAELTPDEYRLLDAFRNDDLKGIMRVAIKETIEDGS